MAFIGTGTIISGLGFTDSAGVCLLEISGPNPSRESIDFTCMNTTDAKVFNPSQLVDWGEITASIAFDPSEDPNNLFDTTASSDMSIKFGDSASTTWSFKGFVTGYDPTTPLEDRATADVTIKITKSVS